MTKIYPQNRDKQKKRKTWIFIFAVFALLGATNGNVRNFTIKVIVNAISPVFKFSNFAAEKKDGFFFLFKNKQSLEEELNYLKEKNIELENKVILLESVQKENEELKALLSRPDKKSYILGSIVSRPPQSPYDMIVIDAGSDNGVKQGMKAVAYGSILIGHVAEVFPGASKIKLVSYSGEETNLIIENAKISAIGLGLGGGNIEVKIPSSVKIYSGDKINTDGTANYLLGTADKIEADTLNPFQKIIFRMPVNLNELQKIGLEK
jgi:rod shape-determining protein MreC